MGLAGRARLCWRRVGCCGGGGSGFGAARLRRKSLLHQQQRDDVSGLGARQRLAADGTLRAPGFAGAGALLAGYQGFHETCVTEDMACAEWEVPALVTYSDGSDVRRGKKKGTAEKTAVTSGELEIGVPSRLPLRGGGEKGKELGKAGETWGGVGEYLEKRRNLPHEVAVRSLGVSMQMTQVRFVKRGGASAPFCDSCWALTCSARCFCSASASGVSSSIRSIRSISSTSLRGGALLGPPLLLSLARPPCLLPLLPAAVLLPSFRLARFGEGLRGSNSGEVASRLRRAFEGMGEDGESVFGGLSAAVGCWA